MFIPLQCCISLSACPLSAFACFARTLLAITVAVHHLPFAVHHLPFAVHRLRRICNQVYHLFLSMDFDNEGSYLLCELNLLIYCGPIGLSHSLRDSAGSVSYAQFVEALRVPKPVVSARCCCCCYNCYYFQCSLFSSPFICDGCRLRRLMRSF
jgi:hypothetical protein